MQFQGRTAIVTGAARGIGQGIALALAQEGAAVVAADVLPADETVARIAAAGGRGRALTVDVTDPADAERMVADAEAAFGGPHILVNNAGIAADSRFFDATPEEFERIWRVNVAGVFHCSQAAARRMAKAGAGRIVTIASISGLRAVCRRTTYGTSKAAAIQLTRQMAMELGPYGITANAIAPGPVDTDMALAIQPAEMRKVIAETNPLGRYGTIDEMAAAVLYLVSDAAGYVNGHVLEVDGGSNMAGVKFDD